MKNTIKLLVLLSTLLSAPSWSASDVVSSDCPLNQTGINRAAPWVVTASSPRKEVVAPASNPQRDKMVKLFFIVHGIARPTLY